MGQSRIFQMLPGFGVLSCHATKKTPNIIVGWKKKKTSQNKLKKKLNLENHDSISTKITHSKKMSWVTNLKCCSVEEKKTVQKLLSPPQSKIKVKKLSEYNELPQWLKVLPQKNLCFGQTNL